MCFEQILCLLMAGVTLVFVLTRRPPKPRSRPTGPIEAVIRVVGSIGFGVAAFYLNLHLSESSQTGAAGAAESMEHLVARDGDSERNSRNLLSMPVEGNELMFILVSVSFTSLGLFGVGGLYRDVQRGTLEVTHEEDGFFKDERIIERVSVESDPNGFWSHVVMRMLMWLGLGGVGLFLLYRLFVYRFVGHG